MRMRGLILLRAIAVAVFVLAAIPLAAYPNVFSAEVVGTGTLVARISGPELEISATLSGEVECMGEAVVDGQSVRFSARGTFIGFGVRGITTMITEGWVTCSLSGDTDGGQPVEIRGLLYVKRKSFVALAAGEPIMGSQYTVLVIADSACAFSGDFTGAARGQLEAADVPMTIQLGGTAIVYLTAEAAVPVGEVPASIPIDHPALGPEILRHIDELVRLGGSAATDELPEP